MRIKASREYRLLSSLPNSRSGITYATPPAPLGQSSADMHMHSSCTVPGKPPDPECMPALYHATIHDRGWELHPQHTY